MSLSAVALRMLALLAFAAVASPGAGQQDAAPFRPRPGQPGKDAVWVPTPQALVDTMLDMAKVTPKDVLLDLGSGDGIIVISAAKRGTMALGIEYNPDLVALSRMNAVAQGVTGLARFEEGDLLQVDLSKATVITTFLMPALNMSLRPKLLDLKPGTRIVSNTFGMEDWVPDETKTLPRGGRWSKALLWIVPAKVAGAWRIGRDTLSLDQRFQTISGTLGSAPIVEGTLRGDAIGFTVGADRYTGHVNGDRMAGTYSTDGRTVHWSATRRLIARP